MNAIPLKPKVGLIALIWLFGFSCFAQAQVDTKGVEAWLASTIIPDVTFHDTPVGDAIQTLRNESRQRSADHESFSVFLKLPGAGVLPAGTASSPSSASPPSEPRITLTMHKVSVLSALQAIAAQAGMKVKVEQYAVSIVPASETTEPLSTVILKVSPEFMRSKGETTEIQGVCERTDARAWLEASGMTFPPGSAAIYLPRTHKLVIRNTRANLDLVADVTHPGEKAIKQTPANP